MQSHGCPIPHVPSGYTTHLSTAYLPENRIAQDHLYWGVTQVRLAVLKAGGGAVWFLCLRGRCHNLLGAGHAQTAARDAVKHPPGHRTVPPKTKNYPTGDVSGAECENPGLDPGGKPGHLWKSRSHLRGDCVAEREVGQWLSQSLSQAQRQLLVLLRLACSHTGPFHPRMGVGTHNKTAMNEGIKQQQRADGPRDGHTEWSKSDKERQISYDVTYTWNQKKMMQIN